MWCHTHKLFKTSTFSRSLVYSAQGNFEKLRGRGNLFTNACKHPVLMKEGRKQKQKARHTHTQKNLVCSFWGLEGRGVGVNLLQDCLMAMLLSNLTHICSPAPGAADVARQRGLSEEWTAAEERGRMFREKEEGLYILSTPIHNVHNTDDWGNMFCHTVTVENKCINSCFVYRGCQPNCCGQGLRVEGMGTPTAVVVTHAVGHLQ